MSSSEQRRAATSAKWLSIVGIGEDGVDGLGETARRLVSEAEFVFGGKRHLALAESLIAGEARAWPSPFSDGIEAVRDCAAAASACWLRAIPSCTGSAPRSPAMWPPTRWTSCRRHRPFRWPPPGSAGRWPRSTRSRCMAGRLASSVPGCIPDAASWR
jgi:hypothetical protein